MGKEHIPNYAVGIIVILALFGGVGAYALLNPSTASTGGTAPGGTTPGGTTLAGCAYAPSLTVTATWVDNSKTPAINTQAAMPAEYYAVGGQSVFAKTATLAGAPNSVTTGVTCTQAYWADAGNNIAFYLTPIAYPSGITPASGASTAAFSAVVGKYTAPTYTGENGTNIVKSSAPISLHKISGGYSNGQSITEYSQQISEGNGYFGAPGGTFAISYLRNQSEFGSSIAEPGCNQATATFAPLSNSTIGSPLTTSFQCSSLGPNQQFSSRPTFQIGTLNANTAISANIIVFIQPGVNLVQNGQVLTNQYYNSTSSAAPIAAIQVQTIQVWQS